MKFLNIIIGQYRNDPEKGTKRILKYLAKYGLLEYFWNRHTTMEIARIPTRYDPIIVRATYIDTEL